MSQQSRYARRGGQQEPGRNLIITHPGAGTLTYGALFALVNAVLISTVAIAIRRMST